MPTSTDTFQLDCRGRRLDCRPGSGVVMGILNVTPDSFYDGGRYNKIDAALFQAETMLQEGAAILDIGGESSRPAGSAYGAGAAAVAEEEERWRIEPVVEAIRARFPEALLSIDTYKPAVAQAALDRGAAIINDITGLREYPEMADVAAQAGAPLIVMHALGKPGDMPHQAQYTDVVTEVRDSLQTAVRVAEQAGVRGIITDPGIGFGKTLEHNLQLIHHIPSFIELGRPVLIGVSRKSVIGQVLGGKENPVPPAERLFGSLGATATAVLRGASIVRTHDVRATVEMVKLLRAVEESR